MGTTNSKKVDNAGEVNNIIQIKSTDDIRIILIILTSLVGASLLYQVWKDYRRGFKKRIIYKSTPMLSQA